MDALELERFVYRTHAHASLTLAAIVGPRAREVIQRLLVCMTLLWLGGFLVLHASYVGGHASWVDTLAGQPSCVVAAIRAGVAEAEAASATSPPAAATAASAASLLVRVRLLSSGNAAAVDALRDALLLEAQWLACARAASHSGVLAPRVWGWEWLGGSDAAASCANETSSCSAPLPPYVVGDSGGGGDALVLRLVAHYLLLQQQRGGDGWGGRLALMPAELANEGVWVAHLTHLHSSPGSACGGAAPGLLSCTGSPASSVFSPCPLAWSWDADAAAQRALRPLYKRGPSSVMASALFRADRQQRALAVGGAASIAGAAAVTSPLRESLAQLNVPLPREVAYWYARDRGVLTTSPAARDAMRARFAALDRKRVV